MPLDEETRRRLDADEPAQSARDASFKRKRGAERANGAAGKKRGGDPFGPAAVARRAIDAACQRDEFDAAWKTFEEAREKEGTYTLAPHSCNVLLHMCAGGSGAWTSGMASAECVRGDKAVEITSYMEKHGIAMNEMSYTALARVRAASGDVDGALEAAALCKEKKLTPKVRTYACALHACARGGELRKMERVDAIMRGHGLLLTELEFMEMLKAYRIAEEFDAGFDMLRKMRTEIRCPSEEMCEELRVWFGAAPGWCVADEVSVDGAGAAVAVLVMDEKRIQIQLKAISLTEEEREDLLSGIAKLACEREAISEFENFMNWLKGKKDGMNAVVDGANVGMYNQNFSTSGMNFNQVEKVLEKLRRNAREGDAPPMVFLHQRRVENGPARKPQNQERLAKWDSAGELFTTAHGSNDDWYWLYAAVHAGDKAVLVTNDECRDHVFQMLPAPKLFYRWKERHQVRFSFTTGEVDLEYPALFTTCMQEADDGSWWMFPQEDDGWLCACKQ